jgi:Peptidase family M23
MRKYTLVIIFLAFTHCGLAQLTDKQIYDLKAGRVKPDNSPVYHLPFAQGSKFLLIQAYNSKMSHRHELSLDFKMKKGSKLCAARAGVVTAVKSNSDVGGLKDEYLSQGNHIIIKHADGSEAMYWHLKKDGVLVNVGDTVAQGQPIGYSGNTGYSAFPHLHFQVYDAAGKNVATRFKTKKGIIYLRPGKYYKAVN